MIPQKHHEAVKLIYLWFFITTNEYPDFEEGKDWQAIKRRLKIFQTKALKRKSNTVTVIILHISIIDYNKIFAVCFFKIFQTLNFPTQYGFNKNLDSCL